MTLLGIFRWTIDPKPRILFSPIVIPCFKIVPIAKKASFPTTQFPATSTKLESYLNLT